MVCSMGVSDRAVWHFAATLLCSLPSGHTTAMSFSVLEIIFPVYKVLSVGMGCRVLRCNKGWLAALLGFLLQDFWGVYGALL